MKNSSAPLRRFVLLALLFATPVDVLAGREMPDSLKPWQDWATWDAEHRNCPTPWNTAVKHFCFWPGTLDLTVDKAASSWRLDVVTYEEATWVPLPGGAEVWPLNVRANDGAVVVVEHRKQPAVRLPAGRHELTGEFRWKVMPQRIPVPQQIGVLSLVLEGSAVAIPNWDPQGNLWLRRTRIEATARDLISAQVYRVSEDGIPMWLRTEIELKVSGKSREEDLGNVLPEGWRLAQIESRIPVAVDDTGRMKAQVRAGTWVIRAHAFRTSDSIEFKFAPGSAPATLNELVAFQASPEFRMAEVVGVQMVDVTQTTFPEKWRSLPVYQWPTDVSFRLVEKMRGMGLQKPAGLRINRRFWLDEDGKGLTYRDDISGQMQQIWRLDIATGQELGAVRVDGKGQLITANPQSGAHGVELRARNVNLQAIGRVQRAQELPATGWQSNADALSMTFNLPPGWRLLALFGADWVSGDWLTAWSLLDLFLLLIFSLAVLRLWGWKAGLVAFLAFGLGFHEPNAPRYTWLFLLVPLALLRVVPAGGALKWLMACKYAAVAALLLCLVPFVALQMQTALYPQLEQRGSGYHASGVPRGQGQVALGANSQTMAPAPNAQVDWEADASYQILSSVGVGKGMSNRRGDGLSNLFYDSKTKIQTGPAEPEWTWNVVRCGWNGPVSAGEKIRPMLISPSFHRVLTVFRVLLLVTLAGVLLRRKTFLTPKGAGGAAVALLLVLLGPSYAFAEVPDEALLTTLRERVLEASDAYPNAAEIPTVELTVGDGKITMLAEIHAAEEIAVPLPGRLPSWSPVSVKIDGDGQPVLRREDGYLWVVLAAGVHRVQVDGLLPDVTEWEWTFLLQPRRVSVEAPGWTVTGVNPDGVPETQVFFARQRKATAGEAEYDRKDFNAIVAVNRHLEIGLVWQVRTEVVRLSKGGRAVSLKVPLLDGEKVLTSNVVVEEGRLEVKLAAGQEEFAWQSELPITDVLKLSAATTDRWVERWHLVSSPVWNVALAGLSPIFDSSEQNLVPVWNPWPGEEATLSFSKPAAVSGDTMTVRRVRHEVSLGSRQRTSQLQLEVECSLGEDFVLELDPGAEISSLKQDDRAIPVRRDGDKLIVPVHPGKQTLTLDWRENVVLQGAAGTGRVTLPVEAANITTILRVPLSRWVLWANGPLRGPAVRFWTILLVSILAAWVLGTVSLSPLRRLEWMLLAVGLTQVHIAAALYVVGWFFLLAWRGTRPAGELSRWRFNSLQVVLVPLTVAALAVLVGAVREGLLGNPEMFIRGNNSTQTALQWFQPRGTNALPEPGILSISVWYYRLLMLGWALWLAAALIRWLKWSWVQFTEGGFWKRGPRKGQVIPPPVPSQGK
ncbi:MAG: hypothetical protein O2901_06240 [Verrucomicrobia bacterium]|nr:hypothetical protein [Verrucomicrobiota bacterium]